MFKLFLKSIKLHTCVWVHYTCMSSYCYKPIEILLLKGVLLEFSTTNRKLLYKYTKIYTKLVDKLLRLQTFSQAKRSNENQR